MRNLPASPSWSPFPPLALPFALLLTPAVAGSPPLHLPPFAPTGREPRLPHVAKNKGGGSPTFPGLIYWRGLCTHPPRRTPPHAPGKGRPALQHSPNIRAQPERSLNLAPLTPLASECPAPEGSSGKSSGGRVGWTSLSLAVAEGVSLVSPDLWVAVAALGKVSGCKVRRNKFEISPFSEYST